MCIKARTFENPDSNSTLVFANTSLTVTSASEVESAAEADIRETAIETGVVTASVATITLWDEITAPTPAPPPAPTPTPFRSRSPFPSMPAGSAPESATSDTQRNADRTHPASVRIGARRRPWRRCNLVLPLPLT